MVLRTIGVVNNRSTVGIRYNLPDVTNLDDLVSNTIDASTYTAHIIKPSSDTTTAIRLTKSDGGTNVAVLDTTNGWLIASTALESPKIKPIADSSTGIVVTKADGSTAVMTIDTSATRVLIGESTGLSTYSSSERLVLNRQLRMSSYGSNGNINFYRADGTESVKTDVVSGDILGQIQFGGLTNSTATLVTAGQMRATVDAAPSATAVPVRLTFHAGSTTTTERMRITYEGKVAIGSNGTIGSDEFLVIQNTTSPTNIQDVYTLSVRGAAAAQNAISPMVRFSLNTNGGAGQAGLGGGIALAAESSTTNDTLAAQIDWDWQTATHASRAGEMVLSAYNVASKQEGIRITGNASGVKLSFYAGTPQLKQTVTGSRGANAALASLLTALANLGLITDSTS